MSNDFGTNVTDDEAPALELPPVTVDYVREVPDYAKVKRAVDPNNVVYNEPRIRIILEENDGIPPSGQYFGLQGIGYILRPGKEADVPVGIVDILNQAVQSTPVVDDTTKQVVRFKDQLRFPYRVLAHIPAGSEVPRAKLS